MTSEALHVHAEHGCHEFRTYEREVLDLVWLYTLATDKVVTDLDVPQMSALRGIRRDHLEVALRALLEMQLVFYVGGDRSKLRLQLDSRLWRSVRVRERVNLTFALATHKRLLSASPAGSLFDDVVCFRSELSKLNSAPSDAGHSKEEALTRESRPSEGVPQLARSVPFSATTPPKGSSALGYIRDKLDLMPELSKELANGKSLLAKNFKIWAERDPERLAEMVGEAKLRRTPAAWLNTSLIREFRVGNEDVGTCESPRLKIPERARSPESGERAVVPVGASANP